MARELARGVPLSWREQSEQRLDAWDTVFGTPIIALVILGGLLHHSGPINNNRKTLTVP